MHRRTLILGLLLIALALPLAASQFVQLPFEQVASESQYVVRGRIVNTWTAWDDAHEVIYTYATVRATRYFGESAGPDTLIVKEVGGTVDGYTMEAIGFPMIREGEDVVLFLAPWEEGSEMRIHAFNQGKFLVKERLGREVVVEDMVRQGDVRATPAHEGRDLQVQSNAIDNSPALSLDEFAAMVDDARAGKAGNKPVLERQ